MPPDASPPPALKLRAEDADDLAVISACLQDALVPVRDLAYDQPQREFLFVANRFRWENGRTDAAGESYQRVLSALVFHEVAGVSYRGFRRTEDGRILSLLAIRSDPDEAQRVVHLDFSGGAEIRLELDRIRCHLKDLGEPWPTGWHPDHPVAGTPSANSP